MTSELKVDKITPASGTNTQIGEAGDTTNLSAGTVTLPTTIITGQTEKTSLADADKFLISDSAASGAFKYVQNSNLGGGGLIRLGGQSTHTNASAYEIDNVFSNTYTRYKIIGVMMQDNTSETVFAKLRSWDGSSGANLEASSYCQATTATNIQGSGAGTPTGSYANEWNDTKFTIANNNYNDRSSNQYGIFIDYTLYRPDSSAYLAAPYIVGTSGYWRTSDGFYTQNTAIAYDATTTNLGGIRFFADNGNMSMIDVSVYGIVGS